MIVGALVLTALMPRFARRAGMDVAPWLLAAFVLGPLSMPVFLLSRRRHLTLLRTATELGIEGVVVPATPTASPDRAARRRAGATMTAGVSLFGLGLGLTLLTEGNVVFSGLMTVGTIMSIRGVFQRQGAFRD
jgi:hypothetical protein